MPTWEKYSPDKKIKIKIKDRTARLILNELGELLSDFHSYSDLVRPQRTRLIKDRLSLLGKRALPGKPEYKVYANRLSEELCQANGGDFKNAEWLFDLHWYVEGDEPYTTVGLPLVMECEWNPRKKGVRGIPYSGIKYDFQKLLVSNADLRLMIFSVGGFNDLETLNLYFENVIANYKNLAEGSKFLFVAFFDKERTFYYKEISK